MISIQKIEANCSSSEHDFVIEYHIQDKDIELLSKFLKKANKILPRCRIFVGPHLFDNG